ncbi:MAG: IclR family transcriptional regulator [Coriobacteriales bacterium]|nr:IclR family transcriptional regulator [Coriobacteriales bacterium]
MDNSTHVVDRVFSILEYLSLEPEPKGPTEIATAIQLHKSTVHRLLSTLCNRGYVERTGEGRYHIGVKLVEIASNHIDNLELQTEARPLLNELREALGLVVHLGILDHTEVVYVEKMDISRNLRLYTQIGMRVPAHCSSLGKCLLANLSGDDIDYLLPKQKLERYTPNTITSVQELKAHLREVRLRGWAIDNGEYIVENRCISAPIFDYRGEVIAAVSASGPESLLTEERIPTVVARVKETATQISRRLCYRNP